jgi:hypothetical protein
MNLILEAGKKRGWEKREERIGGVDLRGRMKTKLLKDS